MRPMFSFETMVTRRSLGLAPGEHGCTVSSVGVWPPLGYGEPQADSVMRKKLNISLHKE